MTKTNKNIDLGESFEKLKTEIGDHPATSKLLLGLKQAYDIRFKNTGEDAAGRAFGFLSSKVKEFLLATTEIKYHEIDQMLAK